MVEYLACTSGLTPLEGKPVDILVYSLYLLPVVDSLQVLSSPPIILLTIPVLSIFLQGVMWRFQQK